MKPVISVEAVSKIYDGFKALNSVDLQIGKGEIFALLGPNGAGKTTLISIICGTVSLTSGRVLVEGRDVHEEFRATRRRIGLVPQEIALDIFATVKNTVTFSRALFGKPADPAYVEALLADLALWDKRDARIIELSGGMKRRVMIAKALSHKPDILFLDEPTAGVDVELRRDMWTLVRRLRAEGVTIVLTTHYIEEAEEMADRVGVMKGGRLLLVEQKSTLMRKLGKRRLAVTLDRPMIGAPAEFADLPISVEEGGRRLVYSFAGDQHGAAPAFLRRLSDLGIAFSDIDMQRSSLEDIFVDLVGERA